MTTQVRINNGGRFRGENARQLRLKAAFELVLQLSLIAPLITLLWYGGSGMRDLIHDWPGHVAYVVRCLITGRRDHE